MKVAREIVINKSVSSVWEVVGNQFADAHEWASLLRHSEGAGKKISAEVCESRTCDVRGMGRIHENIIEFSPERYVMTYEVQRGFPFFVKRGTNSWRLISEGEQTRLIINANIEMKGLVGMLMEPILRMKMSGMLKRMGEDLKYFIENGAPHPRKKRS